VSSHIRQRDLIVPIGICKRILDVVYSTIQSDVFAVLDIDELLEEGFVRRMGGLDS